MKKQQTKVVQKKEKKEKLPTVKDLIKYLQGKAEHPGYLFTHWDEGLMGAVDVLGHVEEATNNIEMLMKIFEPESDAYAELNEIFEKLEDLMSDVHYI